MFNFFSEIKKDFNLPFVSDYTMVNLTGKALYVEGHLGIMQLSKELISFRVKGGVIVIEGNGLT